MFLLIATLMFRFRIAEMATCRFRCAVLAGDIVADRLRMRGNHRYGDFALSRNMRRRLARIVPVRTSALS
jgi:hypothetical protein